MTDKGLEPLISRDLNRDFVPKSGALPLGQPACISQAMSLH